MGESEKFIWGSDPANRLLLLLRAPSFWERKEKKKLKM